MKTARKNLNDLSNATVIALAKAGINAAREMMSAWVLEMIEEDGSALVTEITAALAEAGLTKSEACVALDCAIENENQFELNAGHLIVRC